MKPKFSEKCAYWFDNYMAKGPWSIFIALVIVFSIGFILLGAIRVAVGIFLPDGSVEASSSLEIWRIFLQLTDPGNMAQDNDSSWYVRIFAVISGMFGIIFFSAVIAFITTQLDLKLEDLKKGRSRVLESNHILILGWSNEIVEIIRELIIANESESRASVVILSAKEKEEMDDYLAEHISERKTTKIITRNGETGSLQSLARVAVAKAKSIIILPTCNYGSEENEKAHSDAHTLKTMLAVVGASSDSKEKPNVVAQVYNNSNREIMLTLAPEQITIVDPENMVAKIAVQTSRSSGLAAVYTSLIGFDGCEFYMTNAKWNGMHFSQVHYHYPDGVAIGVRKDDGEIIINPDPDYTLEDNDDIIILAEDDSTIKFKAKPISIPNEYDFSDERLPKHKEKGLIIGWNNKAKTIINEYKDYIVEGSEIDIILTETNHEAREEIARIKEESPEHTIHTVKIDLLNMAQLLKLGPEKYNSIIILTSNELDQERADAATINILLMLREAIKRKCGDNAENQPQIITEVLNSENLELISQAGVNDAIISTKMVSKVLSQIAEEPDILEVYEEMFKEEGSEIYLKPLSIYVNEIPQTLTFADLLKIAHKREEICLGYRKKSEMSSVENNFGVVLNPDKNQAIDINDIDTIIVIAEDEL